MTQCEIAAAHGRGPFVSIEYLCFNSGYAVSSWVGHGFFFAMPSELLERTLCHLGSTRTHSGRLDAYPARNATLAH